ncbi:hypothetical protein [Thalassorhabdomicrobium marinisediminis]|uniref:hypothetical protein n=1 Tax=Thalassorhabdomicrobium marinisediminis TaxID=2170577 RepID=UPI002491A2DB|nr:hypothetical protein [Thalassorhabdomicrobium marinisediminis]
MHEPRARIESKPEESDSALQLLKTGDARRDHHQSVADTILDMASWSAPRFPEFLEWDTRAEQFGRTAELMYLLLGDTARFCPVGSAAAADARAH